MNEKVYEAFLKFLIKNKFQKRINYFAKKYKNKKIIIYGAGVSFDVVEENFDISGFDIIGISDLKFDVNHELENCKGYKIIKPSEIEANNPDIVLIFLQEYYKAEDFFENTLFKNNKKIKYKSIFTYSFVEFIQEFFVNLL